MFDKRFKGNRFHPLKGLFFLVMITLFLGIGGAIVMFLWNAILPDVTGFKPITFWQALGLLVLFKILFGGFGRHRGERWNRKWNKKWNHKMKQKWMNMTDEEKAAFKSKWKNYCDKEDRER